MPRPRLPKTDLRIEEVDKAFEASYEYGSIVETVVDNIVGDAIRDLDDIIDEIQVLLSNKENLTVDDLTYYIAYLPTVIYFATDRAESIGIHYDSSSVIRKQKFDDLYLLAKGKTVNDKTSETNKMIINEEVIESAYKRSYKKLQSRIESADMVLNSLKKVLQWNISELETSGTNYQGGTFNAKRNNY